MIVLEDLGLFIRDGEKYKRHWLKCKCQCGKEILIRKEEFHEDKLCNECHRERLSEINKVNKPRKKKNVYKIIDDVIYVNTKYGDVIVDIDMLELIDNHYILINSNGYPYVNINCKQKYLHHIVVPDIPEGYERDHINRNKLDNRRCNLRIVTPSENSLNREQRTFMTSDMGTIKTNTSGYTDISFDKSRNKWYAQIKINGESIFLGRYEDIEDAIQVRQEAEIKYSK